MTNDKITIREGDVEVTYTSVPMTDKRQAAVAIAASAFLRVLVDSSAFSTEEFTENNSRSVEY